MKRLLSIVVTLFVLLTGVPTPASAAPQILPELSYKFYPLRDLVFVDFYNPYFVPVGGVTVNMIIREGTGRNRTIAIGQTRLPNNLVLMPGEHTSARIPIRARVVRDIPPLAQFEFRIVSKQIDEKAVPPEIVVQDNQNGTTLELNKDADGVPFVMGFIGLSPSITEETTAQVDLAILTFYDEDHKVVWSEFLPVNGKLKNDESFMVWGKYEQANASLVPDIVSVETKFVVSTGKK